MVYRYVPAERVPARAWRRPAIVVGLLLAAFTQVFAFLAPLMTADLGAVRRDRGGVRAARLAVDRLQHAADRRRLDAGAPWRPRRPMRRRPTVRARPRRERGASALGLAGAAAAAEPGVGRQRQPALDARLGRQPTRPRRRRAVPLRTSRAEAAHRPVASGCGRSVRPASVVGASVLRALARQAGVAGHWGSGRAASSRAPPSATERLRGLPRGRCRCGDGLRGRRRRPGRLGHDVVAGGRRGGHGLGLGRDRLGGDGLRPARAPAATVPARARDGRDGLGFRDGLGLDGDRLGLGDDGLGVTREGEQQGGIDRFVAHGLGRCGQVRGGPSGHRGCRQRPALRRRPRVRARTGSATASTGSSATTSGSAASTGSSARSGSCRQRTPRRAGLGDDLGLGDTGSSARDLVDDRSATAASGARAVSATGSSASGAATWAGKRRERGLGGDVLVDLGLDALRDDRRLDLRREPRQRRGLDVWLDGLGNDRRLGLGRPARRRPAHRDGFRLGIGLERLGNDRGIDDGFRFGLRDGRARGHRRRSDALALLGRESGLIRGDGLFEALAGRDARDTGAGVVEVVVERGSMTASAVASCSAAEAWAS